VGRTDVEGEVVVRAAAEIAGLASCLPASITGQPPFRDGATSLDLQRKRAAGRDGPYGSDQLYVQATCPKE
jgi:hypothetical protein